MFHFLLWAVVAAAAIHIARLENRTRERVGELALIYLLVGYCGIPMVVVAVGTLAAPARAADILGFPPGNPFQAFMGWAYLGMATTSVLALRYRGVFLIGPAVCWALFFAGATAVHFDVHGPVSHRGALIIFASHGLVSVLLAVALWWSGLLRRRA